MNGHRVFRLISVTDADGHSTTLSYTNSDPSLITGVTDPFGRTAVLRYDSGGRLTNITDAASLSSSFKYDGQNWITNLTTPYGTTAFEHVDNGFTNNDGSLNYGPIIRAMRVVDAVGGKNVYVLRQTSDFLSQPPIPTNGTPDFDSAFVSFRDSFHWGPRQAGGLPSNVTNIADGDYLSARCSHWLHSNTNCTDEGISQSLSLRVEPSPDGVHQGQATWYTYKGAYCNYHIGTNSLPGLIAQVLPDDTTWYSGIERDAWGRPTLITNTYSTGYTQEALARSWQYDYDGADLVRVIGPQGETLAGYAYTNHLIVRATNAVGDVTFYTYDSHGRLTSIKTPAGLTRTNIYFPSGPYTNFIQTTIDLEISSTNSYTYTNDLVYTHTDERGLTTTYTYDALNRLTNSANSLGTTTYVYDRLDLVQTVDKMGFTTSFAYDAVRRRTAETNAMGRATLYNYCSCGALDWIQDALGDYTYFTYDNVGRRIRADYPDSYTNYYAYNLLGELVIVTDSAGVSVTNWYNNQGLRYAVQDAAGYQSFLGFDIEDRVTTNWDANGLGTLMTYDYLGRLLTRTYPDAGVESFGYSARGLVAYTNQLGYVTHYAYDQARRKTAETNANSEVIQFSYNAAGDLLTLTDGKNQTTTWGNDQYGRVTNKLDQASAEILRYAYDPDNRLTNRWSVAKGATTYRYDPVGNLTNVAYPVSPSVSLAYDALNRVTNMVDGVGTTRYTYTAAGQLLTEDGPFTSDTVTNVYSHRRRVALGLQQPSGAWTNGFGWDYAGRLISVASPAGTFDFTYTALGEGWSGRLVQHLDLPGGAYITNFFDPVARVLGTLLKSSGGTTLDSALYGYNVGNQRTAYTNAAGTNVLYTYDPIGQLTVANSSTNSEDRGYAYDTAWNLDYLTNNGAVHIFTNNSLNELTGIEGGSPFGYDDNGNLIALVNHLGLPVNYAYDDENRLIAAELLYQDDFGVWQGCHTEFLYDGLGRLRQRLEYLPEQGNRAARGQSTLDANDGWYFDQGVQYLYDGWRVIQERDGGEHPRVSYTRGIDLSGSLEGAGGIGGLLARSSGYSAGNWTSHACYHADANGNITSLIDTNQSVVASYRYDPFGNTISQSGSLADDNVYRFSSKEIHTNSVMYYYGYRFYDPSLQRWINRDPLGEEGFQLIRSLATTDVVRNVRYSSKYLVVPNLYAYVANRPPGRLDAFGLYVIEILEPAETAGGNTLNCGLVSETSPIQGDPTPGPSNHNGQNLCIWRCSYYGDEPPKQGPITVLTFTPPNKPCPLPKDCNGHPAQNVGYQHNPILNPPNPYE